MIFVIKVTTNKEDKAVEMIAEKLAKAPLETRNIYSLAKPHGLRGYFFLEASDRQAVEDAVFNMPYIKGIVGKTITYESIKNMIEPAVTVVNIQKGDIVEIIGEPFNKEKARVLRVDEQKEEVVVTLLGATIPIPVTVKLDNLKVIRREKEEETTQEVDIE